MYQDKDWVLDFNNGDKVSYKTTSGNKYNTLCGIEAVDSFNDKCTICITKTSDSESLIQFKYGSKVMNYTG